MNDISCKAAIFDLDGVITRTATVHFKAWKRMFEEFLKEHTGGEDFREFTYEKDYIPYVDGKPRYDGVDSFLRSRDIEIPYGSPDDPPDKKSVCGLGNRKNDLFRQTVSEDGVEVYESTVSLVHELRRHGVKTGVVSSSKNCTYILEQTGLIDLFETVVDGQVAKEHDLAGKPAPETFLFAARELGVKPGDSMMVEDALSGVESGRRGNFGLVVGVSRTGNVEEMYAHGADWVVDDLEQLTLEETERWFQIERRRDAWNLTYHGYAPEEERLREALTTVGNGYMGSRGAIETETITDDLHYPGTYIAGLFNRLPTDVHGKTIYNNDLVNCPNWLFFQMRIGDGPYFRIDELELLEYTHNLNMRNGVTSRRMRLKDGAGNITLVESNRIVSMDEPHLAALQVTITPQNYSETVTVRSGLDGRVYNYGVARYRELNQQHLDPVAAEDHGDHISLVTRTNHSEVTIFMRAHTAAFHGTQSVSAERTVVAEEGFIVEELTLHPGEKESVTLEKSVGIASSRDPDLTDPEQRVRAIATAGESFDTLLKNHEKHWHELWDRADVRIEGDRFAQRIVRLHIYHLLATASPHNSRNDVGMPARGLHGEAYRGHYFWDELFTLPFFNLNFHDITRSFLVYRYRRLDKARENARKIGAEGAMYPWQSADSGAEESQELHYNPRSGEWDPDLSRNQRHISIAIAYNIFSYVRASGDNEFLHSYGAEMILEIARFWASTAFHDSDDRYHTSGMMGPDEFHEKYPNAEEGGFRDNAYTNIAAAWLLHHAAETFHALPESVRERLSKRIALRPEEPEAWRHVARGLTVVWSKDGIISQFDGYMDLEELDWSHYRNTYANIRRMDRILKAEDDTPDRYKVAKQADALMPFFLFEPETVKQTLEMMGYPVEDIAKLLEKNYDYYQARTSHGSTLSYVVHAALLRYISGREREAWEWFLEALKSDVFDTQGGTTLEGIHCGVMGGTIEIIVRNFAGVRLRDNLIEVNPHLPPEWTTVQFSVTHQKRQFDFSITRDSISVQQKAAEGADLPDAYVQIGGHKHLLESDPLVLSYG